MVREAGARVVVFPELSLTGYELGCPPVGVQDPRLDSLRDACRDTRALALAGAPVRTGAGRSIGVLAIWPDRVEVAYRKMWLWGDEMHEMVPGQAPAALSVDGWRLGLAVCRDTEMPEHARLTAALGIDAYVAGVLERAGDDGVLARRAQRITAAHSTWVIVASFAGPTGGGFDETAGGSATWTPRGDLIGSVGPESGLVTHATLR